MVRFGAGTHIGFGVMSPYGMAGTAKDIDFLIRPQEDSDGLTYKRTLLDPKDLSSYDTQFDQVQPGEQMVEGSVNDKCTFAAMHDFLRMFNGSNPAVSGVGPFVYAFTGNDKPTSFQNPSHYQSGGTARSWTAEVYIGTHLRSPTETISAAPGAALSGLEVTDAAGPSSTLLVRKGGLWGVQADFLVGGQIDVTGVPGIGATPWQTAGFAVGQTVHVFNATTIGNSQTDLLLSAIAGNIATFTEQDGTPVVFTAEAFNAATRVILPWDSTYFKPGAIVTFASTVDVALAGVYVMEALGPTDVADDTMFLRHVDNGWLVTDTIAGAPTTYSSTTTSVSATYQESTFYHGCNIRSMRLRFSRNDYVQRTFDWMGTSFTLGASSHSYRQSLTTSSFGATCAVTATTITRASGSWITDGYVVGGKLTVHASDTASDVGKVVNITAVTATVLTYTNATLATDADNNTLRVSGTAYAGAAEIFGGTPGVQHKLFITDYVTSNPGQGATKFLTLGGTHFVCREAELTIEEPLEWRYDIGQSGSELPIPEEKRSVKITATVETSDNNFIGMIERPDTKSFGAPGSDYPGSNVLQILGAGSTAGRSLVFNFPRLVMDGEGETRVKSIGVTLADLNLVGMALDVQDPAYTVVVTNGDPSYRT